MKAARNSPERSSEDVGVGSACSSTGCAVVARAQRVPDLFEPRLQPLQPILDHSQPGLQGRQGGDPAGELPTGGGEFAIRNTRPASMQRSVQAEIEWIVVERSASRFSALAQCRQSLFRVIKIEPGPVARFADGLVRDSMEQDRL